MRDNGAIKGAADGFKEGDEVIVMQHKDGSVVKVLGHVDGVVPCKGDYLIVYNHNYCIVWDLKEDCLATTVLLNTSTEESPEYAVFPCLTDDISNWLNETENPEIYGNIFGPFIEIGRYGAPYVDESYGSNIATVSSRPSILGTTDISQYIRTDTILQDYEGPIYYGWGGSYQDIILERIYDIIRDKTVYGCYDYSVDYIYVQPGPYSYSCRINSHFTDYADELCLYQFYVRDYFHEVDYNYYICYDYATILYSILSNTIDRVWYYKASTPFESSWYDKTFTFNHTTVNDSRVGITDTYTGSRLAKSPAYGICDLYSKKSIIHIMNFSTLEVEQTSPTTYVYTIQHQVVAKTSLNSSTSSINPLTISTNTALKNAILDLLNLVISNQGVISSSTLLYNITGEIKNLK